MRLSLLFAYCDNKLVIIEVVGTDLLSMYKNNMIIGYNDICRIDPLAHQEPYKLAAYALEKFKQEGIQLLSLGLSPFYNENHNKPQSIVESVFSACYKYGDAIYNFYGISHHKSHIHPQTHPVYFSSPSATSLTYFGLARTIGQFFIFLKPTFLCCNKSFYIYFYLFE